MPGWIARERTKLMAAIDPWISANDRGATAASTEQFAREIAVEASTEA